MTNRRLRLAVSMTKKKAAFVLAIAAIAGLTLYAYYDMRQVRRMHTQNLLKAEHFKGEFDRDVESGTRLEAVEEYLRTKPVQAHRTVTSDKGRTIVNQLMIEVINERSPVWGCGRHSVGIIAKFVEDRLETTTVWAWSFDCV